MPNERSISGRSRIRFRNLREILSLGDQFRDIKIKTSEKKQAYTFVSRLELAGLRGGWVGSNPLRNP